MNHWKGSSSHKPRVYWAGIPRTLNGGWWAWRCEEHEREMRGYTTQAEAMDAAAHHYARRH